MDPDLQLDPLNPPKYCPQCARAGVKSKVKKFKMDPSSPDNVTIMCKNDQCPWPFSVQSPADVTVRSTSLSNTTSTPVVKDRKRKKKAKSDDQGDQDTSQEDILFSSKKSKYESSTLTTITNAEVARNKEVSNQTISPPQENPVDNRFKVSLTKKQNCVINKDQDQVEHLFITDDLNQKLSLQPLGLLDKICTTKMQSCKEKGEVAGKVKFDDQPVDEEALDKDFSTLNSKIDPFSSSNDVQIEVIGKSSVVEPSRTSFLPDKDSICPTELHICDNDGDHGTVKYDTQVAAEEASMKTEPELICQNNLIEPVFPICESLNKVGENFALENIKSADLNHTTQSQEKKESINEGILLESEACTNDTGSISIVVLQKCFSSEPLVMGTKNSEQQIQTPYPVMINHVQDMNKKRVTPLTLSLLVESPLAVFSSSTCLASMTQLDNLHLNNKAYEQKKLTRGNEEVVTRSGRKVKSSRLQTGGLKTGKVQEIKNKFSDKSRNNLAKSPIKAFIDFEKSEEKMRIERLIRPPYPRRRSKNERKPVSVLFEQNPLSSQLQREDLNPGTKHYEAPSETNVTQVIESILTTTDDRTADIDDEVVCVIKPKHTFQRVSKKRKFLPSITMEPAKINHNVSEISLLPPNTDCFITKNEESLESILKTTDERELYIDDEVVCVIKPKRTFQRVSKQRKFAPIFTTKPFTNTDAINLEPARINHNVSKISLLPPNTDCSNTNLTLYKLGTRSMSHVEADPGFPFEFEPNNNPVGHHRLEDSRKQNVKPTMEDKTDSKETWFKWRDWKVDQEFLQDFSDYIRNIISKWNLEKKSKIDPRIQALLKEKEENNENQQHVLKKIDFFAEVFVKYLYIKTHFQTLSLEKVMGMLKQNFILENQKFVANISQIKEQLSTTNNSQDNSTHSFGQESSQVATQVDTTSFSSPHKAHLSAPLRPPCPEQPIDLSATANPVEFIVEENLYHDVDKPDNQSINPDHGEMSEESMDLFDNVENGDVPRRSIDLSTNIENDDLSEENMELSTKIGNVDLPEESKGLPTNIENRYMPKESRYQSTKIRDFIDQSNNLDRVDDVNLLSLLDEGKTTQLSTFYPERLAENAVIKSNKSLERFKHEETTRDIQAKGMKSIERYKSVCKAPATDVPEKFRQGFAVIKSGGNNFKLQKDETFKSAAIKNKMNTNGKEIKPFLTSSKALRKDQLNVTGLILADAKTTSGVLDKKMNSSRRKSSTPSQVLSQKPNQEKLKLQLDEALSLSSNKHQDVKKSNTQNTQNNLVIQKAQTTCTAAGGDTGASVKIGSFDQAFARKKKAEKIQKVLENQKIKAQEGKIKKYRGFGEKLDPKALPLKKVKKEKSKDVVIKKAEVSNSERDLINELLNIGEFAVVDSKSTSDEQEVEAFEHSKDTSVDASTVFDAFDFDEFQLGDSLPTDKDLEEDLDSLFGF